MMSSRDSSRDPSFEGSLGFGDPIRANHREAPTLPSFDNCAEPAALPEG